jgi:hypothetical protein
VARVSACVLDVQIQPPAGRPGDRVSLRVRASGAAPVSSVRIAVVGYGLEDHLHPEGPEWAMETTVPFEAGPGEYLVDVIAADADGRPLGTSRHAFRVLD